MYIEHVLKQNIKKDIDMILSDPFTGKEIVMKGDACIFSRNLYLTGDIHKGTFNITKNGIELNATVQKPKYFNFQIFVPFIYTIFLLLNLSSLVGSINIFWILKLYKI